MRQRPRRNGKHARGPGSHGIVEAERSPDDKRDGTTGVSEPTQPAGEVAARHLTPAFVTRDQFAAIEAGPEQAFALEAASDGGRNAAPAGFFYLTH